jgi:uncharacterized protein
MAGRTDTFDLGRLRLRSGEGRRFELALPLEGFDFGGQTYAVTPEEVPVILDVSRMTGGGYSLRLRFQAGIEGPCMRCLADAAPRLEVDAREVDQPGGESDELDSPYVTDEVLDISGWAHDALALALPAQVLCREECAGLCPVCGEDLNASPHEHEAPADPRWAKLRELKLE